MIQNGISPTICYTRPGKLKQKATWKPWPSLSIAMLVYQRVSMNDLTKYVDLFPSDQKKKCRT
jgi:hypothetical protein